MPKKTLPLKAIEPAERPPNVPDEIWEIPQRLVSLEEELGLTQATIAKAAGVTQGQVAKWLRYQGIAGIAAIHLLRFEKTMGLPSGWLTRPLTGTEPTASFAFAQLKARLIRLGIDRSLILTDDGRSAHLEVVMRAFPDEARRAVMGVVHVLGYPLDQVVPVAESVVAAHKGERKSAEEWFVAIRRELPDRPKSGTHLAVKQQQ